MINTTETNRRVETRTVMELRDGAMFVGTRIEIDSQTARFFAAETTLQFDTDEAARDPMRAAREFCADAEADPIEHVLHWGGLGLYAQAGWLLNDGLHGFGLYGTWFGDALTCTEEDMLSAVREWLTPDLPFEAAVEVMSAVARALVLDGPGMQRHVENAARIAGWKRLDEDDDF